MKWVPDRSGRVVVRPHYEPQELDRACEELVSAFLTATNGRIVYPISTNDLTILLEQETADLDLYADLSREGEDIQGVTDFNLTGKPSVRIARELSEQPWRENRRRTTLTHELGHVKFHNVLWASTQLPLLSEPASRPSPRCQRESLLRASPGDWMEWQAGYASGAMLMPLTPLRRLVAEFLEEMGLWAPPFVGSPAGQELIRRVQAAFQVSSEAARVRLAKLGHVTEHEPPRSLFRAAAG